MNPRVLLIVFLTCSAASLPAQDAVLQAWYPLDAAAGSATATQTADTEAPNGKYLGNVTLAQPGARPFTGTSAFFDNSGPDGLGYMLVVQDGSAGSGSALSWGRRFSLVYWVKPADGQGGERFTVSRGEVGQHENDVFQMNVNPNSLGGCGVHWIQTVVSSSSPYRVPGDDGDCRPQLVVPLGEWTHIAYTQDRSDPGSPAAKLYVNGVLAAQGTSSSGLRSILDPGSKVGGTADKDLLLARRPDVPGDFKGHLDDVALFDGVLTAEEVHAIYNGGIGSVPRAVTVTETGHKTAVGENDGATGDTYTMVLSDAPTAGSVVVDLAFDATQIAVDPTELLFNDADWSEPRTVTVTAVNDTVEEGFHTATIHHTPRGGGYDDVAVRDVLVHVSDDEFNGSLVLARRYGQRPRRLPSPPLVEQSADEIVVRSERAVWTFSRARCAIVAAEALGRTIPMECLPNVHLTDTRSRAVQERATDGSLRVVAAPAVPDSELNETSYLHLEGEFTPKRDNGALASVKFAIHYRIHKITGYTIVDLRPVHVETGATVRTLKIEYSLGPRSATRYRVAQVLGSGLISGWQVYDSSPQVHFADIFPFAVWSDGATALEVQGLNFENHDIDSEFPEQNGGRRYLTVESGPDGSRQLNHYVIGKARGASVALEVGTRYRTAFSILPWRKFRPLFEMYAGRFDESYDGEDKGQIASRLGITSSFGYEAGFNHAAQSDGNRWLALHADVEANGLQLIHYVDYQIYNNNSPTGAFRLRTDSYWERWADFGIWMTEEEAMRDLFRNRFTARDFGHYHPDGIARANWPHTKTGRVNLCINSRHHRDYFVDSVEEALEVTRPGLVYIDDVASVPCSNHEHGCEGIGRSALWGGHILNDRLEDLFGNYSPRVRLLLQPQSNFNNAWANCDYANPGEQHPAGLPDETEKSLIYNPFLRGTQIIMYTASYGNLPNKDLRLYEMALSQGCLVLHNPMWPGPPMKAEQRRWFTDFFSPLGIYNVETSTIHHPIEPEYESVVVERDASKIIPVIYQRPGDVLLVAVRKDGSEVPASVGLAADVLGLGETHVLAFDTISRSLDRVPVTDGRVTIGGIPVQQGPRIYRLMNPPASTTLVWHDQVTWRQLEEVRTQEGDTATLELKLSGVPNSEGSVYLYHPAGAPPVSEDLINWDAERQLGTFRVRYGDDATTTLVVHRAAQR